MDAVSRKVCRNSVASLVLRIAGEGSEIKVQRIFSTWRRMRAMTACVTCSEEEKKHPKRESGFQMKPSPNQPFFFFFSFGFCHHSIEGGGEPTSQQPHVATEPKSVNANVFT